MKRWVPVGAGVVLLVGFAAARRGVEADRIPARSSVLPADHGAGEIARAGETFVAPRDRYWDDVEALRRDRPIGDREGTRAEVVRRTARHLGWEEDRASALADAAEGAVQGLTSAWTVRDAEVLAIPGDLDPQEREQRWLDAQMRYEGAKRQAVARLTTLFDAGREPERELLDRLDEWLDAVR